MACRRRICPAAIVYYYERTLSSQVNDIAHIESQSMFGYGVVKIFFQPSVNISSALAQVTAASQTVLKQLPPGITPPYVLSFNASSVPILQLALIQQIAVGYERCSITGRISSVRSSRPWKEPPFLRLMAARCAQIQIDLDQHALQARGLSAQDVVVALAQQNLITPVGTQKVGDSNGTCR